VNYSDGNEGSSKISIAVREIKFLIALRELTLIKMRQPRKKPRVTKKISVEPTVPKLYLT
jgi:hypothetical protein